MGFERVTVTMSEEILDELDEIAKERHEDRSSALRQILAVGISETKIKGALESYSMGKVSIGKAAESAGVSLWRFLDLLKERKVPLKYSMEDAEKEITSILGK